MALLAHKDSAKLAAKPTQLTPEQAKPSPAYIPH
tara:strand:- start:35531 stop:35632 length:102 start_codon:yes stop_codon:yes gene_type:complete